MIQVESGTAANFCDALKDSAWVLLVAVGRRTLHSLQNWNSFIRSLRRSDQNCSLDLRMFLRAFGDGFRAVVICWTVSTASAAESFRCRCGSVRRAPVCSSHASPVAAPHVGQGTLNICFAVSSLVFIVK